MQCKHCGIEITADNRQPRYRTVCRLCYQQNQREYQHKYNQTIKAKESRYSSKKRTNPAKIKQSEQPKEDALFNRLIKRAIYANHALAGHIRAETVKNVMER